MSRKRERGFTIVELLVVITIIGMLMAMLMPAVGKARAHVQRVQCINNQNQIAKAALAYATRTGNMPRSLERWPGVAASSTSQQWHSWVIPLLRELSHGDVYDKVLDNVNQSRNVKVYLADLVCPSDKPPTLAGAPLSYVTNGGSWDQYGTIIPTDPVDIKANGAWSSNVCAPTQPALDITLSYIASHDGTSNTLLIGENVNAQDWNQATIKEENVSMLWHLGAGQVVAFDLERDQPLNLSRARPSSYHDGGFIVAFCDGSTRFLSNKIEYWVYAKLMTSYGRMCGKPNKESTAGAWAWMGDPVTEADLNP